MYPRKKFVLWACLACLWLPVFRGVPARAAAPVPQLSCPGMESPVTLDVVQQRAQRNEPTALYCLGERYGDGQGVAEDLQLAAQWMRKAADKGHVSAMRRYGEMLLQGRGVQADARRAAGWLERSAEAGDTVAQTRLGRLYEDGQGMDRDARQAALWYARAALKKDVEAQTRLGLLFAEGRGVDRDTERAVLLLYGAALQGGQEALQTLYGLGENVPNARERKTLFGVQPDAVDRSALRAALRRPGVVVVREDARYFCDIYDVAQYMPGAERMTICYSRDSRPGLIKIVYPVANPVEAQDIRTALEERFGSPASREDVYGLLWNFGGVVMVTRYAPSDGEMRLLYIMPAEYVALPEAVNEDGTVTSPAPVKPERRKRP